MFLDVILRVKFLKFVWKRQHKMHKVLLRTLEIKCYSLKKINQIAKVIFTYTYVQLPRTFNIES